MFVEIHMLQNHSPANLNRDDTGAPKTAMFGGRLRARISSQCLKRSIRWSPHFRKVLEGHLGTRTVSFPELVEAQLKHSKIPPEEHKDIVTACTRIAKKEEGSASAKSDESSDDRPRTEQLIFLGPTEVREFVRILESGRSETPDDYKKFIDYYVSGINKSRRQAERFAERLSAAYPDNCVGIALFGRMTTSPAFRDVEAAMEVAHAISTNEVMPEVDYFTAVDDEPAGRLGASYLEQGQFNSATFYKYFSLDWDGLLKNLAGDETLARKTLEAFLKAAACTVPTRKRKSFANNNLPDGILVEIKRQAVPTNYANAFLVPARPYADSRGEQDIVADSIQKLSHYVGTVSTAYGLDAARYWFTTRPEVPFDAEAERVPSLPELVQKTLEAVSAAEAAQ